MNPFQKHEDSFKKLFQAIKLGNYHSEDKKAKIRQIISFLEIIDAQVKRYSKNRKLVIIDCAAGNCYLSFLVYHYYSKINGREVEIHCIDHNPNLMINARRIAKQLGFSKMIFYAIDILDFGLSKQADILYNLHACDSATDKALYLGLKLKARLLFSVTCCQHSLRKQFKGRALKGLTRYKSIKSRLVYFITDSMRAHLVAMQGYEVEIIDFTSTRNTEKNIMLRAKINKQIKKFQLEEEYDHLKKTFFLTPLLEELLLK